MKIAKEFFWEMSHRLPFHPGKCKNIHGHSYKALIELEGEPDENGFLLDYYELKNVVAPIIEDLDHAVFVCSKDEPLLEALKALNSKIVIEDYHSTAENLTKYFLRRIAKIKLPENIRKIKVKIYETPETYAEDESEL